MRLLAWNIRQGGGSRLPRIADALKRQDADIVVLPNIAGARRRSGWAGNDPQPIFGAIDRRRPWLGGSRPFVPWPSASSTGATLGSSALTGESQPSGKPMTASERA
jgi:hypothetical protein